MEQMNMFFDKYSNFFTLAGGFVTLAFLYEKARDVFNRVKDRASKINTRTRIRRMWKLRKTHNHIKTLAKSDRQIMLFIEQTILVLIVLLSLFLFVGFTSVLTPDNFIKSMTFICLLFILSMMMQSFLDTIDVLYGLKDPEEGCKEIKRRISEIRSKQP